MKKILCFVFAILAIFSLAACTANNRTSDDPSDHDSELRQEEIPETGTSEEERNRETESESDILVADGRTYITKPVVYPENLKTSVSQALFFF